ncbi:hypothetical protein BpHYR1_006619 [Brachionus plicatilis]|uniref:Uncharacterized protein n=1 Tax=Brachionus plicatilis TaxID=10195 RepID=A0A3M7R9M2_BRAPC|nr:hypothetical protein BpHYR1_006619 [Brachionus plicatilis]
MNFSKCPETICTEFHNVKNNNFNIDIDTRPLNMCFLNKKTQASIKLFSELIEEYSIGCEFTSKY